MVKRAINGPVSLRLPQTIATELQEHLFPGDEDEHGAVIGAAFVQTSRGWQLLGRRLFLARDGIDYIPGNHGYRMLTANFVRDCALTCSDEVLAYLAVHNHRGSDHVAFSDIDMASHRRGYPALLDILDGPPVGGLVFAQQAVAGDIWASAEQQVELDRATIVGRVQTLRYPAPPKPLSADPQYGCQVRLYGDRGQEILSAQKVAIIGAGGAGSLINEFLARLGVGHIIMVDYDRLDPKGTNNPRVVGARPQDLNLGLVARLLRRKPAYKVTISERVARDAEPNIRYEAIVGNVTEPAVAERLIDCDAIFLAADSMQARLVVNAICHQYLIPTWQVGAKVVSDPAGAIQDVFSVVRHLVPGKSCLWCNELIDCKQLAEEATSTKQRNAQRYVDGVQAPSVITLNAVACSHAVDQYLFSTLELQEMPEEVHWLKYRASPTYGDYATIESPRQGQTCSECQGRLGAGRRKALPVEESDP